MTLQCVHSFFAFTRSLCDRVIFSLLYFSRGLILAFRARRRVEVMVAAVSRHYRFLRRSLQPWPSFLACSFWFLCLKCLWLSDNTWERWDFTHVTAVHYSEPVRTRTVTTNKNRESRFGLAVRRWAGKRKDLAGSIPHRLSFLFKSCGLWTRSCDFVSHN